MAEVQNRGATLRRIVTAVNKEGKSVVALDGGASPVLEYPGGTGLYEIWTDKDEPLDRQSEDFETGPVLLCPPPRGLKLRWTVLAPGQEGSSHEDLVKFYDQAFTDIGALGDRPDTSVHPGMHQTKTLDFIILIEGKLRLILEDDERVLEPGDVAVQRGTNHAWVCEGDTPAVFVAVLIDKEIAA